ncbi:MAG: hypothetical protein ABDH31_02135, partial [Chlorobiota bacterium]
GYLLRRSYQLVRLAREHVPEVLPVAVATLMGAVYLFGLGFVDNWWEVTRVVFPLWLFFWTVQAVVSRALSEPIFDEDQETEEPEKAEASVAS